LTELRIAQNLVNGAWLGFVTMGPKNKQDDRLCFNRVKELFRFHRKHEHVVGNTVSRAEICLVKPSLSASQASFEEYRGMMRILSEAGLAFDIMEDLVVGTSHPPRSLGEYKAIVLPDCSGLSQSSCEALDGFMARGKALLASGMLPVGSDGSNLCIKSLGINNISGMHPQGPGNYFRIGNNFKRRIQDRTMENLDIVYLDSDVLICTPESDSAGYLRLIPDVKFGPPEKCYYAEETDMCGLIVNSNAKAAWFPWRIGRHYERRSHPGHALLITATLRDILGLSPVLSVGGKPFIEVVHRGAPDGSFEYIGLVNHTGQNATAFHDCVPLRNTAVSLSATYAVSSVSLLRAATDVEWHQTTEGHLHFEIPQIDRFEIACIKAGETS
jgi:hypothetical protein